MELVVHASNFEMTITEEQEAYLSEMVPMYQRWYHKLDKEINSISTETKKEIKQKLNEGKQKAITVASKLAESNVAASKLLEKAKTNRVQAVEDAIKSYVLLPSFPLP